MSKFLGRMLIARAKCGKVRAATWIDAGHEKEAQQSAETWRARGYDVQEVVRYQGDPQPDWGCDYRQACQCMEDNQ